MVTCDYCGKAITKKSDFLAKPSIMFLYPKLFYTKYHNKCFEESKRTYHGPINFFKNEKIDATYWIYLIVVIALLGYFLYSYPQKLTFSILLGVFFLVNIISIIKLLKEAKSIAK